MIMIENPLALLDGDKKTMVDGPEEKDNRIDSIENSNNKRGTGERMKASVSVLKPKKIVTYVFVYARVLNGIDL